MRLGFVARLEANRGRRLLVVVGGVEQDRRPEAGLEAERRAAADRIVPEHARRSPPPRSNRASAPTDGARSASAATNQAMRVVCAIFRPPTRLSRLGVERFNLSNRRKKKAELSRRGGEGANGLVDGARGRRQRAAAARE